MTPEEIDALDALVKAATPGPWRHSVDKCWWPGKNGATPVTTPQEAVFADADRPCIALTGEADDPQSIADGRAIVALHSAAPALIAAARNLAWHEERHGTRAEQEAEDAELDAELARVDALSDEECKAELAAEGIDYDAARKRFDVTIKLCVERSELRREAERLRDLVRHQRGPLHDDDLITDAEYAALAGDTGAVARLEGYDMAQAMAARLRVSVDAQAKDIVDLKAEVERLRAFVPVWQREDEHTLHLTVGPAALGGVMGPHPESGLWGAMVMDEDAPTEHPDLPTAAAAVCARLGIPSVEVPDAP